MPPTHKPVRRALRRLLAAPLLRLLQLLVSRLPRSLAQAFGRGLGRLAWRLAPRDRRRSLEHLAVAFPERSPEERETLARASFLHHGTTLGEALWLAGRGCREVQELAPLEGYERLEALQAAGRPILIVTGHCGNWELLAAALNCRGLGMAVVARALDEAPLQRLLAGLRARFGTRTIERGEAGAARELLKALRGGGALGMLIDQDTRVENVWVPFFGRLAATPVGAAKMALRRSPAGASAGPSADFGVAVVPVFIERLPDGRHRGRVLAPLELPEDLTEATAAMTRAIEEQIRRVPEQWVWMHRRWRHRPPGETE